MDTGSSLVTVSLALIFVIALLIGLMALVKRFAGPQLGGGKGNLRVLASLPLGQRERAVLIQMGEEQLLLGVAPGRVSLLAKPETPLEVSDPQAFAQTFGHLIKRDTP